MAIANPLTITYGSTEIGGESAYQIHGPYVLEKSYDTLRVVCDVVVVGTDFEDAQTKSAALESAFRQRLTSGDALTIDIDGNAWTYTVGTTLLRCEASITKSGNPQTDLGYARAYTVSISGQLPADADVDAGLRDIEVSVQLTPSRQQLVAMRGTYTATSAGDAVARYEAHCDGRAEDYLDAIDSTVTWELVDESYTLDRETDDGSPTPHLCNWTRQYAQLLVAQSEIDTDDAEIRDHRVTFTDLAQYPGDGRAGLTRMHRVVASYDCGIDIGETTDLDGAFEAKVKPHLLSLFRTNFEPSVFAIEELRKSYDETAKRMSIAMQLLFQPSSAEALVEVSQSVAFREARQIDYTPTHDADELAMEADPGWATVERVWNRTAIVVGAETPKTRIVDAARGGPAGLFTEIAGQRSPDQDATRGVRAEGWNVISSTSQATPQWIGDPGETQIEMTVLTETVVERYHRRPGTRTSTPLGGGL